MSTRAHNADMLERRSTFLAEFCKRGNVSQSASVAGVSRKTAYAWREEDPEFAEQWEQALETAIDGLEAEAWRRGQEGYEEPVFHKGEVCGHITRYSDPLLTTLLKAHKPDKYRENIAATVEVDARIAGLLALLVPEGQTGPVIEPGSGSDP